MGILSKKATLTIRLAASQAAHDARDAAIRLARDFFPESGITVDLTSSKALNAEADRRVVEAETELLNMAKTLRMRAIGAPDIQYGIHGSREGAISFWYQMTAESA